MISKDAVQAAIDHLLSTAESDFGWLSDLPGSTIDRENKAVISGSIGGTIDVVQAVEEVLIIAYPHIRAQIASKLRAEGDAYPVYSERRGAWNSAARTVEEGTF